MLLGVVDCESAVKMESSLCEKPERHASRRLSDHLVLEGQKQKPWRCNRQPRAKSREVIWGGPIMGAEIRAKDARGATGDCAKRLKHLNLRHEKTR